MDSKEATVLSSAEMIELDGDEERISSQGRYAERDIVQVQISNTFYVPESLHSDRGQS